MVVSRHHSPSSGPLQDSRSFQDNKVAFAEGNDAADMAA
jgi:hypothetical protein